MVVPLSLTILSAAVSAERRGLALGAWGAVAGLAIALGPIVGGAITEGLDWHWIFWLNVPIGIVLVPLARIRLTESRGPSARLDLPGLALVSGGLLALVWGIIRGNPDGWTSAGVVASITIGLILLAGFVAWERYTVAPMLPMTFFRSRAFSMANLSSLLMYFGMFGSIFLLSQFLQVVQGYSPFQAGLRVLPWTIAPIFVAPIAGAMSDRIGGGLLMGVGLALQAVGLTWIATGRDADGALRAARPALRHLGRRHGPLLRAGRERRSERGPAGRRKARHRARTMRSARSAASSGSPCWPPSSVATVAIKAPRRSSTACRSPIIVGAAVVAVGSLAAFAIPRAHRATAAASETVGIGARELEPVRVPIEG